MINITRYKTHILIDTLIVVAIVSGLLARYIGLINLRQTYIVVYLGLIGLVISEISHYFKDSKKPLLKPQSDIEESK